MTITKPTIPTIPTIPTPTTDAKQATLDAITFSFCNLGARLGYEHPDTIQLQNALGFFEGTGSCDVDSATAALKAVYMQGVARKVAGVQPEMIPVIGEGLGLMLERYTQTFNGTSNQEVVSWVQRGVERYLQ